MIDGSNTDSIIDFSADVAKQNAVVEAFKVRVIILLSMPSLMVLFSMHGLHMVCMFLMPYVYKDVDQSREGRNG
jgi:hypothetical protein